MAIKTQHNRKHQHMTKELITQTNDADVAALAAAARDMLASDFVGTPLKFQKGRWFKSTGKDTKPVQITATMSFVVDTLSYACGWVKWGNKRPLFKLIGRPVDGFISPTRDRLPDKDKNKWTTGPNGQKQDPWQETFQIVMRDLTDDDLVTWVSTSFGGKRAIGSLLKAYAHEAKQHPGLMPVVLLSSIEKSHPDFGLIPNPVLKLTGWQAFGNGAAPPGSPISTPALPAPSPAAAARPQIEGTAIDDGDHSDSENEFGSPGPTRTAAASRGDMNDEIPF
jgi:hypothetical protein